MRKLYTYPLIIILIIAALTAFFASWLPKAELDNNNFRFVPPDDPALETSRRIDDIFGSSFFILVGLERPYGTVFDREFLEKIQDYSDLVLQISIVKEVTSLLSADYINSNEEGAIIAEKLAGSNFSGTFEEIAELKRRLLSWDMYAKALFSDDFSATQILIPLTISSEEASTKEVTGKITQIRDLALKTFSGYAKVYVTGMPVIVATVNEAMNTDLVLLIPLVSLVVLLVLFFSFRKLSGVILPLLTVLISAVWAVGAMPIFGIKLSVISTVLPVILVAVGSAYGIHLITHYLAAYSGKNMNRREHTELVIDVVMKIRKPVFLAALTTFVGFASFCFTNVAPCREFGYFSAFGVAAAFAIAITLIPSLLIIRGPKKCKALQAKVSAEEKKTEEAVSKINSSVADKSFSAFLADNLTAIALRKKTILFFAAVLVAVSVYGLTKLIIDNVMIEYFREDTDIYQSDVFIRRQFGGSKVVSVVAEADSPEIILHPNTLAAMDGLSEYLQRKIPDVGKVMGFTDLVKRINQVVNADENPDALRTAITSNAETDFDEAKIGMAKIGPDTFGFGFNFDDEESALQEAALQEAVFQETLLQEAALQEAGDEIIANGTNTETAYTLESLLARIDKDMGSFQGMNGNDLMQQFKRQINYEGASYYEIPVNPKRYGKETPDDLQRLIAQYMTLLSGNISAYANDSFEPTKIKSTVQLRTTGMDDSDAVFREIERYIAANFPKNVNVTIGGAVKVENSLNDLVVQSQLSSMLFSIFCVFIIIAVSNRSITAGLIGIIPLSISILLNFAVMGFAGIKLNLGTSMVAAVSVGVGIDYTIHCMEAYKQEFKAAGGKGNFLRQAFLGSGKAIIINAVSVGAGFAVLLLSRFVMLCDLGLLIAITMFSSALVSLTVLPALLNIFKPKFIYSSRSLPH